MKNEELCSSIYFITKKFVFFLDNKRNQKFMKQKKILECNDTCNEDLRVYLKRRK